ncbi:MAG: hypothetical protein AAGA59_10135 [Actinomycetota bacterium]
MDSDQPSNGRKIVMHPRTAAARRQDRARVFGGHVRGYTTETDEVLDLLQAQRRLSLGLLAVVVVPVFTLPLLFRFLPSMADITPIGPLPLPWLLLGPVGLFAIVAVAVLHGVLAGRIEERWAAARHKR